VTIVFGEAEASAMISLLSRISTQFKSVFHILYHISIQNSAGEAARDRQDEWFEKANSTSRSERHIT
jgi:hypothetical protein